MWHTAIHQQLIPSGRRTLVRRNSRVIIASILRTRALYVVGHRPVYALVQTCFLRNEEGLIPHISPIQRIQDVVRAKLHPAAPAVIRRARTGVILLLLFRVQAVCLAHTAGTAPLLPIALDRAVAAGGLPELARGVGVVHRVGVLDHV